MKAESQIIRLAHPAGIMETKVDLIAGEICAIKVVRTARIILEGSVYIKNDYKFMSKLA
jgi:2-methylaconitate cis-trans-isomerase PrpF